MVAFEYAPNGTLFEHLHVPHCNLNSKSIFLTDDYAAKITEIDFWSELTAKSKSSSDDLENSVLPPLADPETNVDSLGILLIEIISGKSPYSEEKESLLNWSTVEGMEISEIVEKRDAVGVTDLLICTYFSPDLLGFSGNSNIVGMGLFRWAAEFIVGLLGMLWVRGIIVLGCYKVAQILVLKMGLNKGLIHNNNFEESVPLEIGKLHLVTELQFDENLTSAFASGTLCIRKFRHCIWQGSMKPFKTITSIIEPIKCTLLHYLSFFQLPSPGTGFMDDRKDCSDNLPRLSRPHIIHTIQHQEEIARRKLAEQSSNLAAAPANIKGPLGPVIQIPRSSGSFRAVPNSDGTHPTNLPSPPPQHESQDKLHPVGQSASAVKQSPAVKKPTNSQGPPAGKSESTWKYVVGICIGVILLILAASVFLICRIRAARTIGPWKTGLSGQLQKAFVTGTHIILCRKVILLIFCSPP
ncbi:probable LRR receptor-like serine/threonine-protein kinase At5g45840 [Solanum tuberosum]|uniref:probable LRR receptor-like serine/threonine-protein kinase At5g45840 n=1 Tax=Solanum tuberosum TaxID=4113 RepID=UPI0003D24207|nr:PREDICTED: probable LRR receptor-like serine/threonine-protein kinase At5g45840 [Solanum tuberosum]